VHTAPETADLSLSPFQRIVLAYDGTLTRLLQAWADEPVEALKLAQSYGIPTPEEAAALDVGVSTRLLRREVVLQGARTGRALVYAHAVLVTDRLLPTVIRALELTREPIGNVLAAHRTETFREILEVGATQAGSAGGHFNLPASAEMAFRTYCISSGGRPIMAVTEQFPVHLFRELTDTGSRTRRDI